MHLVVRRALWLVIAIVVCIAIGMAGYMLIDGAGAFDAFYMSIITMATVGYGETVHLSRAGRYRATPWNTTRSSRIVIAPIGT